MDPDERLDALVAPLRADTVSGAAVVARTAAEVLRRAAVRVPAASLEELRWGLGEVALKVLDAQPSMAPLARLVQEVMRAAEDAETLEEARHAVLDAAEAFRDRLDARADAVAERAAGLLKGHGMVGTISSSSTVKGALLRWAEGRSGDAGAEGGADRRGAASGAPSGAGPARVLCFESRPMDEGRSMAEALAEKGIEVTFAVDAAAYSLVPRCSAVVYGADSIGDRGVVNKIGSAALTHAADAAGVPVYVLCDTTKILPPGFPQVVEDDRPGSEVWRAPAGVKVWNRYFEVVPTPIVTGVVTEEAVLTPRELEARRAEMEFPDFLRRWAEGG